MPAVAACGLPTEGVIERVVTYTLTADCTQTDLLRVRFVAGAVTIDGQGFKVTVPTGKQFLKSHPRSIPVYSDTQVILKNITLEGGSGNTIVSVLELGEHSILENVTIRDYLRSAIIFQGDVPRALPFVYTLKNVLIERGSGSYHHSGRVGSAMIVASNAEVTVTDLVIRHTNDGNAALATERGGTITLEGCYTADGVFPQQFYENLADSGRGTNAGTITNNSSGECAGTIGNGGSSARQYSTPPAAPCGLPVAGFVLESITYSLSGDCQQTDTLYLPAEYTVTVIGNGYRIRGGAFTSIASAGTTTIRNAIFTGSTGYPIKTMGHKTITIERSTFRGNQAPVYILDAVANFDHVLFEGNSTTGTGWYSSSSLMVFRAATVTVNNSTFRNNSGGVGAIFAGDDFSGNPLGRLAIVRLCRVTFEGNSPKDIEDPNGLSSIVDTCPSPSGPPGAFLPEPEQKSPTERTAASAPVLLPGGHCPTVSGGGTFAMGVAACVFRFHDQGSARIEVYGVRPDSTGYFMLRVNQAQVEAAAGRESVLAVSPDGSALAVAWADGNVTIKVGPDHERKILHLTFKGGLDGAPISFITTYGTAPGLPYLAASAPSVAGAANKCLATTMHVLNLRDAPGGKVIGYADLDVSLTILDRSPGWVKVDNLGTTGWLSADYVRESCG